MLPSPNGTVNHYVSLNRQKSRETGNLSPKLPLSPMKGQHYNIIEISTADISREGFQQSQETLKGVNVVLQSESSTSVDFSEPYEDPYFYDSNNDQDASWNDIDPCQVPLPITPNSPHINMSCDTLVEVEQFNEFITEAQPTAEEEKEFSTPIQDQVEFSAHKVKNSLDVHRHQSIVSQHSTKSKKTLKQKCKNLLVKLFAKKKMEANASQPKVEPPSLKIDTKLMRSASIVAISSNNQLMNNHTIIEEEEEDLNDDENNEIKKSTPIYSRHNSKKWQTHPKQETVVSYEPPQVGSQAYEFMKLCDQSFFGK